MSIIEVKDLTKTFHIPHEKHNTVFESLVGVFQKNEYDTFTALNGIDFSVEKGECLGVIGENGSGKSTLLKIIANILRPTEGSVKINGTMASFLELGVGFQADLTAKENIYVYGTIMGMGKKDIDDNLDEIFEFSGLNEFRDMKLKNFSSGMHVRLAFATAIQTKPDILLMDEVLAVGDMDFQQKCLDVFRQYIKEKRTIVFVSHDLGSIRRFCNKALLLRHGKQMAFGDTNEIIDTYVYGSVDNSNEIDEHDELDANENDNPIVESNKQIEINSVQFIDKFGKENKRFNSGDPLRIKVNYTNHANIKRPVFGIALYNENGMHYFGATSAESNMKNHNFESGDHIEIVIKSIPFLQGTILVTLAISNENITEYYDWKDKTYSFEVINNTQNIGIINMQCDWIV